MASIPLLPIDRPVDLAKIPIPGPNPEARCNAPPRRPGSLETTRSTAWLRVRPSLLKRSREFGDLQAIAGFQIAFAVKPVVHGGEQAIEGHAPPGFEKPVFHGKGIVEDGFVGEIAHGEVVDPSDGTGMAGAGGINSPDGKPAREHAFTLNRPNYHRYAARTMKLSREFVDTSTRDFPVRGFLHRPKARYANGLVLTHGAGSNCQSPLLVALADCFCESGWLVLRCDLPFRQSRPIGPPPRGSGERDQAGLGAAVAALRRKTQGRIFLGGHSYGGRQASMLAADEPDLADALLLLSYPLHPPQRLDVLRTDHFPNLRTPAFVVHGTKDEFGSTAELHAAIGLIPAQTELMEISGAGHELMTARNRAGLASLVTEKFIQFVAGGTA